MTTKQALMAYQAAQAQRQMQQQALTNAYNAAARAGINLAPLGAQQAQQHQLALQQAQQQAQAYLAQGTPTASTTSWYTNTVSSGTGISSGTAVVTVPTWVPTATGTTSTLGNTVMNTLYSAQHAGGLSSQLVLDTLRLMGDLTIEDGEPCSILLPDGGRLVVEADGSYRMDDKDAKVIYRANRVRDFNSFVNASDKLEAFIAFCGTVGVRQDEMLNIPIKLFIGWLIIEAARLDNEPYDKDIDLLEGIHNHVRPRCRTCGRFISPRKAARQVAFCRPVCLELELAA